MKRSTLAQPREGGVSQGPGLLRATGLGELVPQEPLDIVEVNVFAWMHPRVEPVVIFEHPGQLEKRFHDRGLVHFVRIRPVILNHKY